MLWFILELLPIVTINHNMFSNVSSDDNWQYEEAKIHLTGNQVTLGLMTVFILAPKTKLYKQSGL